MHKAVLIYRVPYAETDQMGFVYYANYLIYFERSRNELLRANGTTYRQLEEMGIILPVIESYCKYRKPALYDDQLQIFGSFEQISPTRLKAACSIKREDQLLAEGYTIHVCMDKRTGKPIKLPREIIP